MDRLPGCRVYDIAGELGITTGGTSKLVDRIEADGRCRRLPNHADFAGLLDSVIEVNVIVPMVVIDELDRLKETGQVHPRWRAGYTLAVIDRVLIKPEQRRVCAPAAAPSW